MTPKFFKNAGELRRWLQKNHAKEKEVWVGIYKPIAGVPTVTQSEAIEQALCFGWCYTIVKRIDPLSYGLRLGRRKKGSAWGQKMMKRARELKQEGLMTAAGWKAFSERDKTKSEPAQHAFLPWQLKRFKQNKKAWSFFSRQTPSYQKYMMWWAAGAKQRATQEKRIGELIQDSAAGTKLKRVLAAQEKVKPKYEPGNTPIEAAKNLGVVSGAELRALGIDTVERLKQIGWERAFTQWCEAYPQRLNGNAVLALVGAVEEQDRRQLDADLKGEAQSLLRELKRDWAVR